MSHRDPHADEGHHRPDLTWLRATRWSLSSSSGCRKLADAAEHLLSVINNVLDFSKIEAGKVQLERRPFTVEEVLDNIANMTTQAAAAKRLRVEPPIAPSCASACSWATRSASRK
ncbi:MAG: hypothetical protein QM762_19825 [Chryseolinea sp.]